MAEPDTPEPGDKGTPDTDLNVWRFFGLGLQLAMTVALFAGLGFWLDGRFGWTPWGLLGCSILGVVAGMYHFLKATLR